MQKCTLNAMFVGESSSLPVVMEENTCYYFPDNWQDWTPGVKERAEWGWKYYNLNAVTIIEKPLIEFVKSQFGKLLCDYIFRGYPWGAASYALNNKRSKYTRYFLGQRLYNVALELARSYFRDFKTGREIRLAWRLS